MKTENLDRFPLSKHKTVKGSRRLVREKVLQILVARSVCELDLDELFNHIFFREFNFGEDQVKYEKLLKPDEIYEIEADIPVKWNSDEIDFGQNLLNNTISNRNYVDELLNEFANNWELDRIAQIDRVLMHIAVTELMNFPEIPPKVSINEAIDIAKKYSTDKSSIFINGVLDSVLAKLKSGKLINKSGRGLIES